jgi:hypothetical protein
MALDATDLDKIDRIARAAVRDETQNLLGEPTPLARKWEGGKLVLWPRQEGQAGKEMPLESFFHKIVMVRDRLRTLEQQINAHERLTDQEKVNLQQYITRCYGSLTSFNVLFRAEDDRFVGSGGGG